MTVGEKIKYYRNIRGISQEMLGNLSGINPATIKKYEYGIRNPKPDQLLKITNALGISINLFMDFDIETVSDTAQNESFEDMSALAELGKKRRKECE